MYIEVKFYFETGGNAFKNCETLQKHLTDFSIAIVKISIELVPIGEMCIHTHIFFLCTYVSTYKCLHYGTLN